MFKQYKTVRIAREAKFWLNELIIFKENQLKGSKNELIEKYELVLKKNPDFSHGYSPTISIAVTSGSILEAAFNYTEAHKEEIDWNELVTRMDIQKKSINKELDVGTLTPRFYLYSDVLNGLESYREEFKPPEMQRNLMLNYVIKLVIFAYYEKILIGDNKDE